MKSETPRTEAFQKAVIQNIAPADASHWYDTAQKTASFARELERELSQALAENIMLKQCNGQLNAMLDAKPKTVAAMPNEKR